MSTFIRAMLLSSCFLVSLVSAADKSEIPADTVLFDEGVSMDRDEFEQVVNYWSAQMRKDAANNNGDRFELISLSMASKKLQKAADKMTPEADGEWYWKKEFLVRNALRKFMVDRFVATLVVPDVTALAREYYDTNKDEMMTEPERRLSSHILLMCRPPHCDRDEKRVEAQKVLDKLNAGADFEELVAQYSEDPGSREKKGLFDKWLARDEPHVVGEYLMGVYGLDKPGDTSGLVESRFGFHIIRLNEIREAHKPTFKEVKDGLVARFEHDYKKQKAIEFDRKYQFSDDGFIDGEVMEEIFAPYADTAADGKLLKQ